LRNADHTSLRCSPLFFVLGCALAGAAAAQGYPSRPLRFIVPAPPGGTSDLLARVVSPKLAVALGQQVVVDNRGGAGGVLATDLTAKAAPDGLTLLLVYTPHTLNSHLNHKLPYDPLKDFAPITLVTQAPLVLVVNPALPVRNVKELVALAKTRPLNYGSAGNGSGGHVSGELLKMMAKMEATHIPYKGAGPAAADVVGGQLQYQFGAQITVSPFLAGNRLRAIAVTSPQRAKSLPEIPSVAESGFPGFEFLNWFGIVTAAKTPPAIVNRLNSEVVRSLQLPDVRDKLTGEGSEIVGNTPQQFAEFLERDFKRWGPVVKAAGMKVD
jgi:tripartite-type tricarboxylate transporter receptor subunit TctC